MTSSAAPPPRTVPRFEYDLVRVLRFLLGHVPADQAVPLVLAKKTAPPCLSRDAVDLVRDSLAKGLVLYLARAGGWRDERFLRNGRPTGGRVWDRSPLPDRALHLSRHPLAFLVWLTAEKPGDTKEKWDAPPAELTPADELFFMLVLDALRAEPTVFEAVRAKQAFAGNPLCWLLHPADFAAADDPRPPDFGPLVSGPGAVILECLQPALAQRWVRSERSKGQVADWRRLRQQGAAEAATLAAFLAAAEAANRTDLARFLVRALAAVLAGPERRLGLQGTGPPRLADRLATQRAALAVLQQAETLARWDRRTRAVGYFDEEYAASQLWKEDWEAADGPAVVAKAARVLELLEPLRVQTVEGTG
jgi:hypothetical protein